jgi:hypothetical protein
MLGSLTYHMAMHLHDERLRTAARRRTTVGQHPRTRSPWLRGR